MVITIVVHMLARDDPATIAKLKATLVAARDIYRKDKGTLTWLVMQDHTNPRAITAVQRYENEEALKTHLQNPYRKRFHAECEPLLAKPLDLRRLDEMP
ncbi:hypothetical protein DFJ73DRAFT_631144 [Zopfochytrium polystomum]|nr:hypothetical protein DFJ73DRAFT_631144 [Zopfochytrium polystomum]